MTSINVVTGQTTVTTFVGATATLPCNIRFYPQWKGPSSSGLVLYNIEGFSTFIQNTLESEVARLSWGNNQGDLIISNVTKNEDDGQYTCTSTNPSAQKTIQLDVRGNKYFSLYILRLF